MSAPPAAPPDGALREALARGGRRLPARAVLLGVRSSLGDAARAVLLPVAVSLLAGRRHGFAVQVVAPLAVAAALVIAVARWASLRWALTAKGVAVRTGVFVRKHRLVPYGRIQSVDVSEPVAHRLLGLAAVRAETRGGGDEAELALDGLWRADALVLRDELAARRAASPAFVAGPAAAADAPPDEVLHAPSTARLAVRGVTTNLFAPVGAVLALAGRLLEEAVNSDAVRRRAAELLPGVAAARAPGLSIAAVAVAAAGVAVAALGLAAVAAAVASVARFRGYRLERRGRTLTARWGLTTRVAAVQSLDRVEAVRVSASPLQRLAGLAEVVVDAPGEDGLRVPAVAAGEVPALVAALLPGVRFDALRFERSDRLRRARLFRPAALGVAAASAAAAAAWGPAWLGLLALLGPAWGVAHVAWRSAGWGVDGAHVAVRGGVWERTVTVAPRAALRGVRVTASPFQRRAGLVTITADVATNDARVTAPDVRAPAAAALAAAAGVGGPLVVSAR